jgi:predicted nucleic acid-binding protein
VSGSRSRPIVLDSWAVVAYFGDEKSAGAIETIIVDAHESGAALLMTVVNVGEVWYSIARKRSEKDADQRVRDIRDLGITIVDVNWELAAVAARYKRKGKIAYADCFAASLANRENAQLVTGDPEFKLLKDEISIAWV